VIIACVRRLTTQFTDGLKNITSHPTSRVVVCELPDLNGSEPSSDKAWDDIRSSLEANLHGFHIDVLIANAGVSPPNVNAKDATPADFRLAFGVNVIGPLNLFRTFRISLLAAKDPKFVAISSLGGSIESGPGLAPMTSYGSSKAAVNYLTRKIHIDEDRITTLAIDPG
jgi:NAD(P)-dependent dehydrogenase (short-subunit alcohol dehydrogenase family)